MCARPSTTWPSCTAQQGKYADAEGLSKRALAIRREGARPRPPRRGEEPQQPGRACTWRKASTPTPRASTSARWRSRRRRSAPDHPDVAATLDNLAIVYHRPRQVRRRRAALQARAGDRGEGARPRPPRRGRTLNNLASRVPGPRQDTPRPRRSTSARWRSEEKALGQTTPTWPRPSTTWPTCTRPRQDTPRPSRSTSARWRSARRRSAQTTPTWPTTLNNLADRVREIKASTPTPRRSTSARWRSTRRRSAQTTPMWPRPSTTWPSSPPAAATAENALAYSRKATAAVIAHAATETTGAQHKDGRGRSRRAAHGLLSFVMSPILQRRRSKRLEPEAALGREAFVMAQWAKQSAAAAAVQQMGLRFAAGTDALAALVRERQDLSAFWREPRQGAARSPCQNRKTSRTPDAIGALRRELAETESKLAANDGTARTGVPGLCGAGEPEAAQGRGSAAIARRR